MGNAVERTAGHAHIKIGGQLFKSDGKGTPIIEQPHGPWRAGNGKEIDGRGGNALVEMQISFVILPGGDEGVGPGNAIGERIGLMIFQIAFHPLIPIADFFDQPNAFLGQFSAWHGADIEQIAAAHGHDFINGFHQEPGGKIILVAPIAPALLAYRFASLRHGGETAAVGHISFRRGKIPLIIAAVIDQNTGHQLPGQLIQALVLITRRNIPEEGIDFSVAGEQFRDLIFHKFPVFCGIRLFGTAAFPLVGGQGIIGVFMMPVGIGIIQGKQHAMLFAGVGQHPEHILFVGRIHDIVRGVFRIPHAKAVMMLGGEADIFHARFFRQKHPFLGIIIHGIKLMHVLFVFFIFHIIPGQNLLLHPKQGIEAPMDKHAEFIFHTIHLSKKAGTK